MCTESFTKGPATLDISEWHFAKVKAFQILKEWSTSNEDKEYLFLFTDYYQYSHMIIINRRSFTKTVNDNIVLFRYILGRTLTAESLLSQLIKNQSEFWDVLKNNEALIGILLGYGSNNALVYSRSVDIGRNLSPNEEAFPFLRRVQREKPSLGFSSLEEEKIALRGMMVGSYSIVDFNTYPIPCFGCIPESEETTSLLSMYQKNRNEILSLVAQDDFLEKILEKIFKTTSEKIALPSHSLKLQSTFDLTDKKQLASKFVEIIRNEIAITGVNQEVLLKSFLKGIVDREKGGELAAKTNREQLEVELNTIPIKLECCKNLICANNCFKKISLQKQWISLIPKGISYKVLREGKGVPTSSKIKNVSFHLSYRLGTERDMTHFETIKQEGVEQLIPGIAHSLIGMKRGEQRMVCIHPRYAYGVNIHPNNATFFAEIQLIDFEEEEEVEARISPPARLEPTYMILDDTGMRAGPSCELDTCEDQDVILKYQDLLKQRQNIYKRKFYNNGFHFWDLAKIKGDFLDFEDFYKQISFPNTESANYFKNSEQKDAFIMDFKLYLFTLQYENGRTPPFPQSWL